ncbi:polysaccharide deacetylase family protein [Alkalicoccus daliensis]|uniref:Polysaccharide deacetylase n=1 Tax=Alkalicoccus daliensis TaxID=745820 RepID=A0A1G9ZR00_9BACI|nr:polysaccharide deacetylase family protein [Alkalicoccus daliensis]SDN23517.1 Polysaccharide deacetylase [Alkalicoccus daliensis]
MKKTSVLLGISTVLFMTACGNENNSNEASENVQNNEVNNTNEDNINGSNEVDNSSNNNAENTSENASQENEESSNDEANENAESETLDENNDSNEEEEPAEAQYEIRDDSSIGPISDAEESVVLLTIDDAPDNHGVEMAEALRELDAEAIFFVNGHFIQSEEGQEQLQEIYDLGFEIGNHTMSHPNLSEISEEETYEEIVGLNDLIEDIIGERPRFFRAPFGVNSEYSDQIMEEENMQRMNWSYGYDYFEEYMEAEALAEIMVETDQLRDGANLLMHDRSFTLEALEDIVEGLRDKGYEFVDPALIEE